MQVKIDRINQVLREQITGVRVIRAFVRTRPEAQRFGEANADLTATALRVNRVFALAMPALMAILNLSSVAVLWFGGRLVSEGSMPIGNLTAFLTYILQILMSVMMAVMMVILVPRAVASAERVEQVLGTAPSIADPPAAGHVRRGRPAWWSSGTSPSGTRAASSRCCTTCRSRFPPGKTSAIIGGTGSGKTTLLNLIPRFFDATGGSVLVNGVDVRDQEREAAVGRDRPGPAGGVPVQRHRRQQPAVRQAGGHRAPNCGMRWRSPRPAISSRPCPASSTPPIDQGGTNVSGGQRQRLSIARALVKQPRLYLFDDCFSALDAATDARLRMALKTGTRGATVVIVAQRVSTIMHADQIIVLDEGRVAGMGTHRELMAGCAPYREIVVSQLGEEAAA